MYSSRSLLKSSKQGHFLPRKNSSFIWPNTAPLRRCRCSCPSGTCSAPRRPPPTACTTRPAGTASPCPSAGPAGASGILDTSWSSSSCCWAMLGCSDVDQATISLLPKIVDRREVGLAPGLLELGDVGAHLLPRPAGGEVPADDVLESFRPCPCTSCTCGSRSRGGSAADAHLAHHLQRRLVGYAHAPLGAQAHGDLPAAAPVGGAREYLGGGLPRARAWWSLRARQRVVVARPRQAGALEQVGEGVSP